MINYIFYLLLKTSDNLVLFSGVFIYRGLLVK